MLNKKVILINGLTRSGTNILWNLIQSHPRVCSPIGETNSLLHLRGPGLHRLSRLLYRTWRADAVERFIDRRLYEAKLQNLGCEGNRERVEGQSYTHEEVQAAALCLKAVNEDVYLTDMFCSMYEDIHILGLARNGYAVCEGMVRRGVSAAEVGKLYAKYMSRIIQDSRRLRNYRIVRFEEIVKQPFETAQALYEFCGLEPSELDRLRFKAKGVKSPDGEQRGPERRIGDKYWLDRETIEQFMDPEVDSKQARALDPRDKRQFEERALPILEYFSYA